MSPRPPRERTGEEGTSSLCSSASARCREWCAEYERFRKIDGAFRAGDLAALRAAVDDPDSVPNEAMPLAIGPCLEYAIYHGPLACIRTLLEIGADSNPSITSDVLH